jgi:hypothetical protein
MIKRLPPVAVISMRSALVTLRLASQIPARCNFDGWAHKADVPHRPQLMSLLNWFLIIIGISYLSDRDSVSSPRGKQTELGQTKLARRISRQDKPARLFPT